MWWNVILQEPLGNWWKVSMLSVTSYSIAELLQDAAGFWKTIEILRFFWSNMSCSLRKVWGKRQQWLSLSESLQFDAWKLLCKFMFMLVWKTRQWMIVQKCSKQTQLQRCEETKRLESSRERKVWNIVKRRCNTVYETAISTRCWIGAAPSRQNLSLDRLTKLYTDSLFVRSISEL